MNWIKTTEQMPEAEKRVLAVLERNQPADTITSNRIIVRAMWVPRFTVEDENNFGDGEEFTEYNEEKDAYFWPEGWYECIETAAGYEDSNCWHMGKDVAIPHWMPMPELPATNRQMLRYLGR